MTSTISSSKSESGRVIAKVNKPYPFWLGAASITHPLDLTKVCPELNFPSLAYKIIRHEVH
uniref:Uncharacterized protein n=1 Tax=Kwoniella bestiolae CBS 10118 TaxID=1296100 RepID=A0A1B9GGP0_9TREE|nr:hypothetical protein I302_01748 [Kwoniella bestiolae CBS 10118]OCF30229.1 hypothetical protein I302_01748 [Kwoniella bestiolae CBS 10118]